MTKKILLALVLVLGQLTAAPACRSTASRPIG
jgi:hypothetical protein